MQTFAILALCLGVASAKEWNLQEWNHFNASSPQFNLPISANGLLSGTWNTGLFPGMDPSAVIDAIPRLYGVLALQEVWDQGAAQAISSDLHFWYPYSYYVPPSTTNDIGCAPVLPESLCESVLGVRTTTCAALIAADLIGCLIDYNLPLNAVTVEQIFASPCSGQAGLLLLIDNMCPVCLMNAAFNNGGDPQATYNTCMNQQGPRYAFGGSVGQLILSKLPLGNVEVHEFSSYGTRRANIYATVAGLRYGFVHFPYDMLLDAGLSAFIPPLPGDLQSVLAAELIATNPDVILGDFNSGADYQPQAFDLLRTKFADLTLATPSYCTQPLLDAQDPRCCANTQSGVFCRLPLSIDHVFLNKKWRPFLDGDSTFADEPVGPTLVSDHVGLEAHGLLFSCSLSNEQLLKLGVPKDQLIKQ